MTLNRTIYEIQHQGEVYRVIHFQNNLMHLYRRKKGRKTEKYKWKFLLARNGQPIDTAWMAMTLLVQIYSTRNI